ncbi:MAG: hypothetical protein FWB80_03670 [Defluviitaleaceae bacterium]|nr:hypothetical protein [Defluviitaleaceae bacterium]
MIMHGLRSFYEQSLPYNMQIPNASPAQMILGLEKEGLLLDALRHHKKDLSIYVKEKATKEGSNNIAKSKSQYTNEMIAHLTILKNIYKELLNANPPTSVDECIENILSKEPNHGSAREALEQYTSYVINEAYLSHIP